MLHRGMDWLWVVVEGEENSDYTQIKTANRRVSFQLCTFGYPLLQNTVFLLFQIVTPYFSIQVVLVSQLLCWTGQFLGMECSRNEHPRCWTILFKLF
ncbi:hypothetical protein Golax_013433 [Gossypium laxum]|uniref:Uncharacterized protein n=1 Tax=Gossypium laxum TaxID=34288 RepID=A0A7J8ZS04_9ROSI|nr:hypothetical protein [Gossypium laxum]